EPLVLSTDDRGGRRRSAPLCPAAGRFSDRRRLALCAGGPGADRAWAARAAGHVGGGLQRAGLLGRPLRPPVWVFIHRPAGIDTDVVDQCGGGLLSSAARSG